MSTAITVGFYGKLPMLGDFVGRQVPEQVVGTWDAWLQQAVATSKTSLAERWLELYLTAPMWRFFAHQGVLAEQAVAGIMFPSVDRVGRYFPFTVFAVLPVDTVGLIVADRCAGWFERVEDLVLAQLEEENRGVEDFENALSATGPILESALAAVSRSAWLTGFPDASGASADHLHLPLGEQLDLGPTALSWLDQSLVRSTGTPVYWWTGGSNVVRPCWLLTRGLPDPLAFSSMLAGDWQEWPWTSFEALTAEAAPAPPLHMESAGSTHPGKVREENQDAFVSRPEDGLWAVADGMGGHAEGQVASQMVRDALTAIGPRSSLAESVNAVRDALDRVNEYLHSMSLRRVNPVVSGTTVVAMLVRGTRGVCLWAGDSRLYRLRDSALEQLTADHSEAEESDAASGHTPRSNVITRAIGGRDGLEVDQLSFDIRLGDRFLLCSDGLYRDTLPARIAELLHHGDATTTVETLVEHALRGEAADNITVVVVDAQPSTA